MPAWITPLVGFFVSIPARGWRFENTHPRPRSPTRKRSQADHARAITGDIDTVMPPILIRDVRQPLQRDAVR